MATNNEILDESIDKRETKNYNISIHEKSTKANIRLGTKLIIYLIIAGISGAFFSNILINIKYHGIIQHYEDNVINNDMVILDYGKIIDSVEPSLVSINVSEESLISEEDTNVNWTGIVIDPKGSILTTASAVSNLKEVFVKINSVEEVIIKANVVLKNDDSDLAIIRVECDQKLVPIKFAEVNDVSIGQEIVVIGNTSYKDGVNSVIPGIITSRTKGDDANNSIISLIQISAPINRGNTGGPIVNSKGELVGLASLKLTQKNNSIGMYHGIELSELNTIANSNNAFKEILGVRDGGILTDKDSEFKGFYVQELVKGGNAYKAGIKPTDIILEVDNNKILSLEELTSFIENKSKGDIIYCKVLSDGVIKEIEVKIYD